MGFPKGTGMFHEDVRKRVKRLSKAQNIPLALNQVKSLLNQSRLHDGQGSVDVIVDELVHNETKKSTGNTLSGAGSTQIGFGTGKVWTDKDYKNNGFIKKGPGRWTKVLV